MSAHDRDRELERLLADDGGELGALYRRLPKAEPPRRLDRSVLGEAARAVHGYTPRRQRWLFAFGSAAGVVLAAGLAWHVGQDALQRESQLSAPATSAPASPRPTFVPVAPISEPARQRAHEESASMQDAAGAAAVAPAAKSAPPQQRPVAKSKAVAPVAQPPPPPAAPPPSASVATPAVAPEAFPASEAERDQGDATPARAGGTVGAAAAKDANQDKVELQRRANGAPALSSSVELRRDVQLDPDTWLAHIEQLLRQGRRQQAIESLRLFRNAHPRHALPDELRALLD
jgi:hypothetical protein